MKKALFDEFYSDILLIFDFDPHDPGFTPEKISSLAKYFVESSDMGKLYINYPMVEVAVLSTCAFFIPKYSFPPAGCA